MSQPLLSPDGKYLAFCGPNWFTFDSTSNGVLYQNIPYGFYIENLENGEITCYPVDSSEYDIVCWAEKDGIDKLINGN